MQGAGAAPGTLQRRDGHRSRTPGRWENPGSLGGGRREWAPACVPRSGIPLFAILRFPLPCWEIAGSETLESSLLELKRQTGTLWGGDEGQGDRRKVRYGRGLRRTPNVLSIGVTGREYLESGSDFFFFFLKKRKMFPGFEWL